MGLAFRVMNANGAAALSSRFTALSARFEPTGSTASRLWKRWRDAAFRAGMAAVGETVEWTVFAMPGGALVRGLLTSLAKEHLDLIRHHFDATFYTRQFASKALRRRVERDPLLHYVLLGWHEGRAPAPGFDPHYFRGRNPSSKRIEEPLLEYIRGKGRRDGTDLYEGASRDRGGESRAERGVILTINHGRGGGSTYCLDLYEERLRQDGWDVLRLRAVSGASELGIVDETGEQQLHRVFDLRYIEMLADYCRARGVTRIVVNHVIDRPREIFGWIGQLAAALACPYDVILHDYFSLCPRVNLLDGLGRLCAADNPQICVGCTRRYGAEVRDLEPARWRDRFLAFAENADRVIMPSGDMARRLRKYLPSKDLTVWEPENDDALPPERPPTIGREEPLRVLCIGGINVPKGERVLAGVARTARQEGDPIEFILVGDGADSQLLRREGVHVSGFFKPEDLDKLLDEAKAHIFFLPAIWPETWSFVLTSALKRGLPVVTFDVGAPAERLRRLARGTILPLDMSTRPAEINARLRMLREQWLADQQVEEAG